MEYIEGLVVAFGTPVVTIALIAFLVYFTRTHSREHIDILSRLKKGDDKFDSVDKNLKKITLITLKQEIMNEEFPIDDRLRAYKQYKELGGNGYMDVYYETVLKPQAESFARGEEVHYGRRKDDIKQEEDK